MFDLFSVRADEAPSAVAFIHGDINVSYGELATETDRVARGLQNLGVGRGDRVLTLAGNTPHVLAIYFAVSRLGAIYVPVSTGFREREVRFVLENAKPKVAVVEAAYVERFKAWDTSKDVVIVALRTDSSSAEPLDATDIEYDTFGAGAAEVLEIDVDAEAGVLLCYTSGTTSTPKPVLHSSRSEIYNAKTYAEVWGLGPGDRGVVCLPLAWVYGLSTTTAALLVSGGTVILLDRFHPVEVIDAIESHRATAMWGTMSMYTKMLEVLEGRGSSGLGSLRVVNNGGEPCPPPLVKEFERLAGVQLLGSYATSEARPIMVVRPGDSEAPEGTCGQLVPGAEIKLINEFGVEVAAGEPGHALLRCPGLMTEYYREPDLTAERLTVDGWLRSGDLLQSDSNGYWFVVGRQTDMIIRSGANIAPAEVESALSGHPLVRDVAVVGVPDLRSGEAIRAVIVPADTVPDPDELRTFLADQVAAYKVPQEFVFVDELPRTDRGKLDRAALRAASADVGS